MKMLKKFENIYAEAVAQLNETKELQDDIEFLKVTSKKSTDKKTAKAQKKKLDEIDQKLKEKAAEAKAEEEEKDKNNMLTVNVKVNET